MIDFANQHDEMYLWLVVVGFIPLFTLGDTIHTLIHLPFTSYPPFFSHLKEQARNLLTMKSNLMAIAIAASWSRAATSFVSTTSFTSFSTTKSSCGRIPIRRGYHLPLSSSSSTTNAQDSSVLVVESMPPPLPPLNNHYYLLRHGQSTANVEGIISSARSLSGSTKHGLTLLGIEQGQESAVSLIDLIAEDLDNKSDDIPQSTKQVYFYSSPFARAKETAEQCLIGISTNQDVANKVNLLGLQINPDIDIDDGLMERFFGRLDGMELSTYAYVWPVDIFMNTHTAFDVESVAAVSMRIRDTLLNIDARHGGPGGNHIVLTSHADVLQITQVYAAGLDNVGLFSQYRFGNGEVRRMGRDVESLPEAVPLQPPKRGE